MAQRISGKARRKQILEVASRMIEREGFDRITAKRLANAAEISDTLIFRHFGTMEDMFEAVCLEFIPSLTDFEMDSQITDSQRFMLVFAQQFVHHNITDPRPIRLLTWAQLQRPDYIRDLNRDLFEGGIIRDAQDHIRQLAPNPQAYPILSDLYMGSLFSSLRSYLVFRTSSRPPKPNETAQALLALLNVHQVSTN
jgi:AcrR family transcriptional regulator